MASHEPKAEVFNGVSTADEPSAAWGWHGLGRRGIATAGVISGLFLLGMLIGNHKGHVEDIWLVALAVLVFLGTFLFVVRPKLTQRTTVQAHNKPVGHIEPDWAADQKNLTGVYADLTAEELVAMNIDPTSVGRPALTEAEARQLAERSFSHH
ncbi:DUF2631 domain-containing protein [Corynebacterium bovis]|uniref:DUF2631 domain-containing protein n=1 Tax=Corynebacterium bovis DSM 20582 = CIP 54.80 TaxID=927655 RepID=A0A8H9YAC0_9CORY|nr:DUF2631 domain-containing protein [Corynebacterium bovis]MBB3116243.1 hypothetical protein [Corynebacterium bovis DSM 20582 = CIP 54.80]MDK8510321.1 DUF2631 domain-containing protein [Corynebacterium bovis]QQC47642.1 DUF2631 domain-containing protein [Corynebacterium bovis]RRO78812.1 DUF2631 domain-containing protein [Corynebacterium bovis]RRO79113.1 DUF2631 domain-containing protein [Corynebacterium bovis]